MAKAKSKSGKESTNNSDAQVEFPFYFYLNHFYKENRKKIFSTYKPITKKFLDYNDPSNPNAYLRPPQFEALEMYVFLKEYLNNDFLYKIFEDWFYRRKKFEGRRETGVTFTGQTQLFTPLESNNRGDLEKYREIYSHIKSFKQTYPNYIFALTMGLGKTVLMAVSIFYEFILANKYPDDSKYCHNALVFAPDKTVLQSLKEIITLDKSLVVPSEYSSWLETHLKFHFLDESGDTLNAIDRSSYNIIISNTQKIILKKQHKDRTPTLLLFENQDHLIRIRNENQEYGDLYDFDAESEVELLPNQRFAKLTRLKNLGIYVDEAHHVFGTSLEKDMLNSDSTTSLRLTINELAKKLAEVETKVIACYNYTGTPFSKSRLLPEVVYSYGLKEAIDNKYLKKVTVDGFKNIRQDYKTFVKASITDFWKSFKGKRYEKMLPKIAFFSPTIDDLQKKLRPAVEDVLTELGIPINKILVNVGDPKLTTNDDIREFISLDTSESRKQFILLVNKGKEGWNCRSLFAVGMLREPKSKVFVLQATMRCLRYIGNIQETALVFLSEDNLKILNKELEDNFKITVDDINKAGDRTRIPVKVKLVPPPVIIKLKKELKLFRCEESNNDLKIDFDFKSIDFDKYRIIQTKRDLKNISKEKSSIDITPMKEKIEYSEFTLTSEISRYLNISPLKINKLLNESKPSINEIIKNVNEFNELIYDVLVPKIFNHLFEIQEYTKTEEFMVELVKEPKDPPYYEVKAEENLIANFTDKTYEMYKDKSFHLDNYCFDSNPEKDLFWSLLRNKKVDKVWFTGMLTHGQTDFYISYIDPESHTVRSYYPDFLVKKEDGSYTIVEVKADHLIDDKVVQAKREYAKQLCKSSDFDYLLIKSSLVRRDTNIYENAYKEEYLKVAEDKSKTNKL